MKKKKSVQPHLGTEAMITGASTKYYTLVQHSYIWSKKESGYI